jgi:2-polyprenyl-6-methoxyphenol hydroxylase-like FAD-dependent oxidoreductase
MVNSNNIPKYDVAIIGASLAGSFSAYLLGKIGYKVILIDPFARNKTKACGEGLSVIGQKYLERTGLWSGSMRKTSHSFFGYDIFFKDGKKASLQSGRPLGHALRRKDIQNKVFLAACNCPNVTYLQEKAFNNKRTKNGNWQIGTKLYGILTSSHLIVASGNGGEIGKTKRYGITYRVKGLWLCQAATRVSIKQNNGYQIILTPLTENCTNICVLIDSEKAEPENMNKNELKKAAVNFSMQCGFSALDFEEIVGASSLASCKRQEIIKGAYFVGDAIEIFDPIGGMGMSHALFSASIASKSIARSIAEVSSGDKYWRKYLKQRNRWSVILRIKTRLAYILNAGNSKILKRVVMWFPRISMFIFGALEEFFPVLGLANDKLKIVPENEGSHLTLKC